MELKISLALSSADCCGTQCAALLISRIIKCPMFLISTSRDSLSSQECACSMTPSKECRGFMGGKTSLRFRSPHSLAGKVIVEEKTSFDLMEAQREARLTGLPKRDALYFMGVPTYPAVTRPLAMPICGQNANASRSPIQRAARKASRKGSSEPNSFEKSSITSSPMYLSTMQLDSLIASVVIHEKKLFTNISVSVGDKLSVRRVKAEMSAKR